MFNFPLTYSVAKKKKNQLKVTFKKILSDSSIQVSIGKCNINQYKQVPKESVQKTNVIQRERRKRRGETKE